MLSKIADITGIISFVLSIILLVKSEAMRKELASQRQDYKKEQRQIKTTLIALRANIVEDNILNMKVVSDIRTQLYSFQQKFKHLLTREDKSHIRKTLKLLDESPNRIDKTALCCELDYFVARFERKEQK